jgi:hypothetical protein
VTSEPTALQLAGYLHLRRVGKAWRGPCPLHGGSSFEVSDKNDRVMFCCWSGCFRQAILAELRRIGAWPTRDEDPAETAARRRAWVDSQRAIRIAEDWQRAALIEARDWQATCLKMTARTDSSAAWTLYERACRRTYELQILSGDSLTTGYLSAAAKDRARVERLVRIGWQERREAAALCQVTVAALAAAEAK